MLLTSLLTIISAQSCQWRSPRLPSMDHCLNPTVSFYRFLLQLTVWREWEGREFSHHFIVCHDVQLCVLCRTPGVSLDLVWERKKPLTRRRPAVMSLWTQTSWNILSTAKGAVLLWLPLTTPTSAPGFINQQGLHEQRWEQRQQELILNNRLFSNISRSNPR